MALKGIIIIWSHKTFITILNENRQHKIHLKLVLKLVLLLIVFLHSTLAVI